MHVGLGAQTLPPSGTSKAGSELRRRQMVTSVAIVHASMAPPPLNTGLCFHKAWGALADITSKEWCLSLGNVNISVRRQKLTQGNISLCREKKPQT